MINTKYSGWSALANLKMQCNVKQDIFYNQRLKINSEKIIINDKIDMNSMEMVEYICLLKNVNHFSS